MRKLIVVTGGSKGIGRAIVEKFMAEGFDAATCSRNPDHLQEVQTAVQKRYNQIMDQIFDTYSDMVHRLTDHVQAHSDVPDAARDIAEEGAAGEVLEAVVERRMHGGGRRR